jgi:hypothetical protein
MGVELGLDCTPIQDAHDVSEHDQRERRNRQRTWMRQYFLTHPTTHHRRLIGHVVVAFMMDRAMASATGRGKELVSPKL